MHSLDRAAPVLVLALAVALWFTFRTSDTVLYIDTWAQQNWKVPAGVDLRFVPLQSTAQTSACDTKVPSVSASPPPAGSVFRASPDNCTAMSLKLYGTMHSRTKALQSLLRIDPSHGEARSIACCCMPNDTVIETRSDCTVVRQALGSMVCLVQTPCRITYSTTASG